MRLVTLAAALSMLSTTALAECYEWPVESITDAKPATHRSVSR